MARQTYTVKDKLDVKRSEGAIHLWVYTYGDTIYEIGIDHIVIDEEGMVSG